MIKRSLGPKCYRLTALTVVLIQGILFCLLRIHIIANFNTFGLTAIVSGPTADSSNVRPDGTARVLVETKLLQDQRYIPGKGHIARVGASAFTYTFSSIIILSLDL